jgi:hypothetical protein
MGGDVA